MASGMQELFDMMARQAKNAELNGNGMIVLGELYNQLLEMPAEAILAVEFYGVPICAGDLFSYRGYYEDLSFDLEGQTTVTEVLERIDDLLAGESYEGYKGGEYYAHYNTLVWVSQYGDNSGIGVSGVELVGDKVFLTTVDTNDR